jgi:uncharacterized protein (TIGR02145 family)
MKAYPFFSAAVFAAIISTLSCSSGDDGQNPSSSSVGGEGNSQSYGYCLVGGICLEGPFTLNDCNSLGGLPSNNSCHYGGVSSSSSYGVSSSSSSSSSARCTAADNTETYYCSDGTKKEYGFVTDDGGQTYKTVVIGDQTWMAENLNDYVEGSKCYPAHCTEYGRLYDWVTALTVCPSGWHLPSDTEWNVLVNYAGGSSMAGTKLKAKSGWKENGNGADNYGFSALPGGRSYSGSYLGVDGYGYWWSSTSHISFEVEAYGWYMQYYYESVVRTSYTKSSSLLSVRCVKD